MAAHGGNDKRLGPYTLQFFDQASKNDLLIRNTAAAGRNCDSHAFPSARQKT
jgi:hypothetical protein